MGEPWSKVGPIIRVSQPLGLGRLYPSICADNDSRTKISHCGGSHYFNKNFNEGNDAVCWIYVPDMEVIKL